MFDTACASLVRLIVLGCLLSTTLRADDLPPLLGPAEESAVVEALRCLKMTPADLSYKKDYAESPFRLGKVQRFLEQPLELARHADVTRRSLSTIMNMRDLTAFGEAEQEQPKRTNIPCDFISRHVVPNEAEQRIPEPLRNTFRRALPYISLASDYIAEARARITEQDIQHALVRYATANLFLAQDNAEVSVLSKIGLNEQLVRQALLRDEALDGEDDEYARDLLLVYNKIDITRLNLGVESILFGVNDMVGSLTNEDVRAAIPPDAKIRIDSRLGPIIIGGAGPTHYTAEDDYALLIIDLGGDDTYDCHVGAANGLIDRPISICIDLGGNDTYRGGTLSQGAGVFGIGILVDSEGNDTYEGKHLCQGAGLYGVGVLADYGGYDSYLADINCQGVGMFGVGILWDKTGDDHYVARECSQGYGYTGGLGLLLDGSGNDTYFAGGKYSDHERQPEHYLSLSQGFGNGMRSDASGGGGILCDLAGDDTYVCDMFGQGASYWYSLGMLLDAKGNDTYRCHQYGQGSGIHLSLGILADRQGNDQYIGGNIVQGAAHDWSVGMLFDKAGNDTYIAKSTAQGSALYNSTALLVDSAGNDCYTSPKGSNTQAAGHDGWTREYGTIALLLDLGGKDIYSNGPRDDFIALKPLHGCALDLEKTGVQSSEFRVQSSAAANTPSSSFILHPSSFSSTPTDISRPQNEDERRWFKLIRQSSQYEDTERKAKDKAIAHAILERDGAKVLPFWLRQCDHDAGSARFRLEEFVDSLGATNAAPALIDALNSPNELVRKSAIYFIGKLKVQGAADGLLGQLSNEKLRAVSLWALGQVKADEAFPDAILYLSDTNEVVRIRATGLLGKLGDPRAVPDLIKALDDPLWDVRYSAQAALIKIGKPAMKPMLAALSKSSNRARPYLIEALGMVGSIRTASALRSLLRSDNWLDRGTAVAAVAQLNPVWKRAEFRRMRSIETNEFVRSRLREASGEAEIQK